MKFKLIKPGNLKVGDVIAWKNGQFRIAFIGTFTHHTLTDEYVRIDLSNGESFVQLPWKRLHMVKEEG